MENWGALSSSSCVPAPVTLPEILPILAPTNPESCGYPIKKLRDCRNYVPELSGLVTRSLVLVTDPVAAGCFRGTRRSGGSATTLRPGESGLFIPL